MSKTIYLSETGGRRGNVYWQVAATIGLAKKFGYKPRFHPLLAYRGDMNLPIEYFELLEPGVVISERKHGYDECVADGINGSQSDVIGLRGGFQSWRYFDTAFDEIYAYMRHKEAVDFGEWSVGVHIRKGDYNGNSCYVQYGVDYYKAAMRNFKDPRYKFFLLSDDYKMLENNFKHDDQHIFALRSDTEDFINLCSCRNFILSGSSFSFWGAFLSPKPNGIVYHTPRTHCGKLSNLDESTSWMPEWEVFENKVQVNLVCYSDAKYTHLQKRLIDANKGDFDQVFAYTREWLEGTEFYKENKWLLDQEKGGGYWAWKPFVILEALKEMNEGDMLLYMDSGDLFFSGIREFAIRELQNRHIVLTDSGNIQKDYTKQDTFVAMDCDGDEFKNAHQVEAGVILVKNTAKTKRILNEWLSWCLIKEVVMDEPNDLPNAETFVAHRHDQSILENISVMHNLHQSEEIRKYIACNIPEYTYEKYDLSDVTFVCCLKYDSEDRLENVELMIEYLQRHYNTNIILGETETHRFEYLAEKYGVRYVYIDGYGFHRTKSLNYLMRISETSIVCNHDCDILVPIDQMIDAVNRIRNGDDFCYPYGGGFGRLDRSYYRILRSTLSTIPISTLNIHGLGDKSVGGCVLANKKSHFRVGGENEHLIGWGFEDICRARRYFAFGKCTRVDGPLYHVDHYVGKDSKPGDFQVIQNTERRKMKGMNNDQLWEYIQTWPWTK